MVLLPTKMVDCLCHATLRYRLASIDRIHKPPHEPCSWSWTTTSALTHPFPYHHCLLNALRSRRPRPASGVQISTERTNTTSPTPSTSRSRWTGAYHFHTLSLGRRDLNCVPSHKRRARTACILKGEQADIRSFLFSLDEYPNRFHSRGTRANQPFHPPSLDESPSSPAPPALLAVTVRRQLAFADRASSSQE